MDGFSREVNGIKSELRQIKWLTGIAAVCVWLPHLQALFDCLA